MLIGSNLFGYVKEPLNPVFRSTAPQTPTFPDRPLVRPLLEDRSHQGGGRSEFCESAVED